MPRGSLPTRLTAQHFELIAHLVRTFIPEGIARDDLAYFRHDMAEQFADILARTNLKFDRARFIEACTRPNRTV